MPAPIDPFAAFRLDGQVAVVTGASSGLGDRFARVLDAAGASVVVAARRAERLEALVADLDDALAVATDVADDDACAALVDAALDRYGRIDVLVNNAGISDAPARAETESVEEFRRVTRVNLDACFLLSTLVAPQMIERGSGSIVNIASVHASVASAPNTQAAYDASKHGLVGLTRELACQWARHGVRVNAIAPGYVETELTDEMIADDGGSAWIARNTPLRRAGRVDELDGALLLLATPAGSYATGSVVTVDGGWTAR